MQLPYNNMFYDALSLCMQEHWQSGGNLPKPGKVKWKK